MATGDFESVISLLLATFRDLWDDLWTAVLCNLVWLVSLPLIVPAGPATLALFSYGNLLAHGEAADLGDFWRSLRRYWTVGLRWGILNLFVGVLLIGDIWLSGRLGSRNGVVTTPARLSQSFYLALLYVWAVVQFYTIPFLLEQEIPHLRQAFRNAAVMVGRNLGFTVALSLLSGAVLLAGTVLFLMSLAAGGVFVAILANRSVLNRLERHRQKRK